MQARIRFLLTLSALFSVLMLALLGAPVSGDEGVPPAPAGADTAPGRVTGRLPAPPAVAPAPLAPLATSVYTIGANFTGGNLAQAGFVPPDTMGAVGPNHVVEILNGRYAVYDKSGAQLASSSLNAFWSATGAPYSAFTFDPRILYDPDSGRWFAAAVDNAGGANSFLVAVSDGTDPTAGWSGWAVDADSDDTHWADFPMLGLNGDVVVVSANMFPISAGGPAVSVLVLPKDDLTGATPTVANGTLFSKANLNDTGFAPQPVFAPDGSALPLPLLSAYNKLTGSLKRSSVSGTAQSPSLSVSGGFVTVTARNEPPTLTQPNTALAPIEAGGTRFSGNVVRQQVPGRANPSLWAVHGVEVDGRAAVEWYEIDAVTNSLLQSGTIGDPQLEFNYPSIAANEQGEVVVGFSGGSGSGGVYMSTYVAVGTTVGGATTFLPPYQTQAGLAGYQKLDSIGRNRWGDYSATVVDPADQRRFWTFQEFVSATDTWAIRITEIILSIPPVTPTLSPGSSGVPISLTWTTAGANCGYEVYSSTAPYTGFNFVTALGDTVDHYAPVDNGQPLAFFYVEATACVGPERARSNSVGWFRFSLVPGT